MKKQSNILLFIFVVVILSTFFYLLIVERDPNKIPSALLNKKIPNFISTSLFKDKKFISKDEFGNEVVLVNFFATWCKPCKDEHSFIKKFSNQKKIRVIGINYKDNPKKTLIWLKKLGNPYSDVLLDKKGTLGIDWGVYGIPETFVIGKNSIVKYRHVGPIDKKIYKRLNAIIGQLDNDN